MAIWNGVDKKGRPVCYMTGRLFDAFECKCNIEHFNKFLMYTIDQGRQILEFINDCDVKQFCFVYDRRELTFEKSIDPRLKTLTKAVTADLQKWYVIMYLLIPMPLFIIRHNAPFAEYVDVFLVRYGNRIGSLYIVGVNIFFWTIYTLIVWPLLWLFGLVNRVIVLRHAKDLLKFIEKDELPPGFFDTNKCVLLFSFTNISRLLIPNY